MQSKHPKNAETRLQLLGHDGVAKEEAERAQNVLARRRESFGCRQAVAGGGHRNSDLRDRDGSQPLVERLGDKVSEAASFSFCVRTVTYHFF